MEEKPFPTVKHQLPECSFDSVSFRAPKTHVGEGLVLRLWCHWAAAGPLGGKAQRK